MRILHLSSGKFNPYWIVYLTISILVSHKMIAVTDEEEIFNFHSCITQISDPDSNIIKELTSKVLATECVCDEKSQQKHSGDGLEINNNNDDNDIDDKGNGARFIKKLFGLVSLTL